MLKEKQKNDKQEYTTKAWLRVQGTNIDFIKEIASATTKPITAAGGISTIEEIVELYKSLM